MKIHITVRAILYSAVAVWALLLYAGGQDVSSDLLTPLSAVTTVLVFAVMAFDLWLWKFRLLHGWFVKRPVIDGTWKAELKTNWSPSQGQEERPIEGYMVVRQTFSS